MAARQPQARDEGRLMAALDHLDEEARDERLEDYALHVCPHAFYEWDGALDAAITEAALLVDGIGAELRFEDAGIVLTVDMPDAEAVAAAGLRDALAECMTILEQAEAA